MKKVLIGLVAMAVLVGFFLVKDYDSPELGKALLDKASEATGAEISATGFRFNLFNGIKLEGVRAKATADGRSLDVSLDELVFEHRVMPLLSGTVAVEKIVLDRPEIVLVESDDVSDARSSTDAGAESEPIESSEPTDAEADAGAGEAEAEEGSGLAIEVQQILVQNGTLVMRSGSEGAETRIESLDLTMVNLSVAPSVAAEPLKAIAAEGDLSVASVVLDTMTMNDVSSNFALEGGVFQLDDLVFSTVQGRFTADASVDFNPVPVTYMMTAEGDPLNMNSIVGADSGFGPGKIQMEASGAGADPKDVRADGSLQLGQGTLPSSAVFAGIDKALGKNVVSGAEYETTEASFSLVNNVVRLSTMQFKTPNARIEVGGTLDLTGPIAFDLSVATPREGVVIEGVGSAALDVLADDEGWVPVPMNASGTMEKPMVVPDGRQLARQARSGAQREVRERAEEAAGDAIRSLFGRKKKNE